MKQHSIFSKTLSGFVFFSLIALTSCQKDSNTQVDNSANQADMLQLTVASSSSQALYDDVFNTLLTDGENNNVAGRGAISDDGGAATEGISSCAAITLSPADPAVYPKTMTIDFGTSGCTSANGITRKGKIIAVLSNRIRTTGTTISITFENYAVNNYKLEGIYSITTNGGTGLNFTTKVTNGKITYPDGTTFFNYAGTHTLAQTAGSGTPTFDDDNFSITGNSTTSSSAGKSLAVTITTALVKNASCKNLVSGIEQFTYSNLPGSLDFGDGTCDNMATLKIGLITQSVTLPR